ncbi:cytochrome c oxidase subunit 3 [Acidobacteria bacterium AH-259-D05]|nr:cytochrome c oxidase subunit 3 [Acidobacteria bacterium AH-259-D05]
MAHVIESTEQSPLGVTASPFAVSWQKLMMWIFIITDGLLFAGFLAAYGFARFASAQWPEQTEVFHIVFISLMTFVLISSSATMATAVEAAQRGNRSKVVRFVIFTILGGAVFLGMQAYEWTSIIQEGARLYYNPWGVAQFSSYFFVITGFHGSHVLIGVIILGVLAWRCRMKKSTAEGVELVGLYWHFVDLVWVFVFTLFYLV